MLRARQGKTTIDRSGVTTESDEPFVPVLRRLMAEFQSPFVPGLPRFTGGAVGFIGYDASPVFEPALGDAWANAGWGAPAPTRTTMPGSCCSIRCSRSITSSTGS